MRSIAFLLGIFTLKFLFLLVCANMPVKGLATFFFLVYFSMDLIEFIKKNFKK